MQRNKEKEKKSGISFRKIFRSIGKPTDRHGSSNGGGGSLSSPRAGVLPSGDNQYAAVDASYSRPAPSSVWGHVSIRGNTDDAPPSKHEKHSTPPVWAISMKASGDASAPASTSHVSPAKRAAPDPNVVRWGLSLAKIPKLVSEATSSANGASGGASPRGSAAGSPTSSNGDSTTSSPADFDALLDALRQMSAKESQAQILQYYTGSSTSSSSFSSAANLSVLSTWEQRKMFKQCRRALLLAWKVIIAQLNDVKSLPSETRDTYYQLVGLIAERVEFNLLPDGTPTNRLPPSKSRSSSNSGFLSPSSTTSGEYETNNNNSADENGSEGERDIYLYRCLLVATFKHVVENIDAANLKKRSFISYAESRFFASVLAICFFRIPIVQRMILDGVFEAYRHKRWTQTAVGNPQAAATTTTTTTSTTTTTPATPSQAQANSRLHRRRSSSKPWNMTFVTTLARWSEFEGQQLVEYTGDNQDAGDEGKRSESTSSTSSSSEPSDLGASSNSGNPFAPPNRTVIEKLKRQNPTLFRWSRYSPYLGPYSDSDVFRTHESENPAWLVKLTHDGEFFASFMAAYTQHAEFVSIGEPVWYCLPGYPLLIRISMLLVKEATWQKWLSVRDTTENVLPSTSTEPVEPVAFEVKSSRSVKTVLDGVVMLLKNREVLESCVMAMFECTNVYNNKSVSVCLSKLEDWFAAAAVQVSDNSPDKISYRLPATFQGQSLGTAVRIMLCCESFEILNRVLLFLYNRLDYFDGELRQSVLKAIVQRHMFLFLHWNADVRNVYHHILVYKIVRTNRYLLDSPLDQLLVGRFAMLPGERGSNGRDDTTGEIGFDDADSPYDEVETRPVLSAAEYNNLRLEQALWRAFDACLAAICVQERRHARDANRKYQIELQAARSRSVAFQKLKLRIVSDADSQNSVNEGLPGGKASHELDLLNEELSREPPYYLRYLPAEEVSSLDELRRLAQTVKYPPELQVYAAISLRGYSDLLRHYFHDLRDNGYAEPPPLGFV